MLHPHLLLVVLLVVLLVLVLLVLVLLVLVLHLLLLVVAVQSLLWDGPLSWGECLGW